MASPDAARTAGNYGAAASEIEKRRAANFSWSRLSSLLRGDYLKQCKETNDCHSSAVIP